MLPNSWTGFGEHYTGHAEVRGNGKTGNGSPLPDSAVTVAEVLKRAGYTTAMIGKWGLGNEDTPGNPAKQGFDFSYGYLDQIRAHNYYPEFLLRNGKKEFLRNKVTYNDTMHWTKGKGSYATQKIDYSPDLFVSEALAFIDDHQQKPFLLYLPFITPHNNGEAPLGERQEVPELGMYAHEPYLTAADAAIQRETRAYAAMVTRLDRDVGRILQKLASLNLDKNTIVIFASDNGPMPAQHQFSVFFGSNAEFDGYKTDLLEGGIRVPLIVRWPGKIRPGSVSAHVSAFWDFLPTVAELTGQRSPAGTDGISFLPTLLGKPQAQHSHLNWEYQNQQAVRLGNWKGIRVYQTPGRASTLRQFNLAGTTQLAYYLLKASDWVPEAGFRQRAIALLKTAQRYAWDEKQDTYLSGLMPDGQPLPGGNRPLRAWVAGYGTSNLFEPGRLAAHFARTLNDPVFLTMAERCDRAAQ